MNLANNTDPYSVSVVIPAYNVAKHICRALDSILAQTRLPDEIIVVDDGSTDNTAEMVQRYGSKVRYIHQKNAGSSAARNVGIAVASSAWVAFLDADDQWMPQALQLQLDLLRKNKQLIWSGANHINCFCDDNKQTLAHDADIAGQLLQNGSYVDYFDAFMARCVACIDTIIVKRSVFDEVGMFSTAYIHGEDMDLWFRIAFRWPMLGYIAQPLAIYHRDIPNSMMTQRKNPDVLREQFDQLFTQAAQHGREAEFKPCAVKFAKYYIDVMLQQGHRTDVLKFIPHFAHLLSFRYRTEMRLRAMFPIVAPVLLKKYMKLKKFFLSGGSTQ